ncbi:hypothetical protein LIA77_02516 [Sarocladium implicatum]|nr:hypothetical protein LIA77_02516 [Sarocladium implicatum]
MGADWCNIVEKGMSTITRNYECSAGGAIEPESMLLAFTGRTRRIRRLTSAPESEVSKPCTVQEDEINGLSAMGKVTGEEQNRSGPGPGSHRAAMNVSNPIVIPNQPSDEIHQALTFSTKSACIVASRGEARGLRSIWRLPLTRP